MFDLVLNGVVSVRLGRSQVGHLKRGSRKKLRVGASSFGPSEDVLLIMSSLRFSGWAMSMPGYLSWKRKNGIRIMAFLVVGLME